MYSYPWKKLLDKNQSFKLFGYGSLINQYSSQQAIKGSAKLYPVVGFGIKRILNYDPDENVRSRPIYHDPERGSEYFGVFNLEYTENQDDFANGVIRNVTPEDFPNLVKREVGYSLAKIKCQEFGKTNSEYFDAYTLVAPENYDNRKLVNNNLLPNVPYYKICKQGAKDISEDFLNVWLDTSFLGDGRNVREWEKVEGLSFE